MSLITSTSDTTDFIGGIASDFNDLMWLLTTIKDSCSVKEHEPFDPLDPDKEFRAARIKSANGYW